MDGAFYNESIRSEANRAGDITDTQMADPHIPLDRYGIIGMTREHLTDDLMAYGDTVSVSDSLYLREMDVWTLSHGFGSNFGSMRNAPSEFGLLDQFEDAFARLGGNWNQDLIQPQQFALQRLPDATVTGRQELFNNLMFADYDAEAVELLPVPRDRWVSAERQSSRHAAVALGRLRLWLRRGGFASRVL